MEQFREFAYLSAKNSYHYISIMEYFLQEFEKLNMKLELKDVMNSFKGKYDEEQMQRDLNYLVSNNNLSIQGEEVYGIQTLEEYKKRKIYYSITSQGIFVARNVRDFFSLSGKVIVCNAYFERILEDIKRCRDEEDTFVTRSVLYKDCRTVFQIYQDFISQFRSEEFDAITDTREFLIYKDEFLKQLHNLINELKKYAKTIGNELKTLKNEEERFKKIQRWFLYVNGEEPTYISILNYSSIMIEKITKKASYFVSADWKQSKKQKEITRMMIAARDLKECHILAGKYFGFKEINHYNYHEPYSMRKKDIREREPEEPDSIINDKERMENEKKALELMDNETMREERLLSFSSGNILDLNEIGENLPEEDTGMLLDWLSQGLNNREGIGMTNNGIRFKVVENRKKETALETEAGVLHMNSYKLEIMQ